MGLSILNNIPSLEAQNQLAITNKNLQNTLFQLSSGSKINSGADDPAGLSIANGLQANISALTQSAQNVADGVGLLQTADGALSQVTTLLNRAVTLATEGGNAGLTPDQQAAVQNEFASITKEINQIGSNTTYNNNAVFTGANMSVFLSDGSSTDAANPTIAVSMPSLSAAALGLASYATGTLDITTNPTAGNTVQIGSRVYTFVAPGDATAADDVALGDSVQTTLQNLQAAVNGGAGAGDLFGAGTVANTAAQITSVNSGSAVVQALQAGTAGNSVILATSLTSTVGGGGGTTLSGGVNSTYDTGTLTLLNQPGLAQTATGTVTMTAQPDTVTNASGTFDITAVPTAGQTVTIGSQIYTFAAAGATNNNDVIVGSSGVTQTDIQTTLTNLAAEVNGTATAAQGGTGTDTPAGAATMYYSGTGDQAVVTAATPGTAGNGVVAFSSTINGAANPNGSPGHLGGGANADTVQIGGVTYTFVAAGTAALAGQVALGSTYQNTLTNLMNAINDSGTAGDTTYGAEAQANQTVRATVITGGNTLSLEAATSAGVANPGAAGNSIVLTANSPVGAFTVSGSGTLTGGADNDTVTIGSMTYTFVGAGQAQSGNNDVALGTTTQQTSNNLMAAVNATSTTGGSASTYYVAATQSLADGAKITSVANGVATVQALNPGVLAPSAALDLGAVFQNGSATGTLGGFNSTLSGGSTGVAATGLIDMTANAVSGDTVTVGALTYTFVASGQSTAGDTISIGATANATLTNLEAATAAANTSGGSSTTYNITAVQGAAGAKITAISGNQATVTANTTGATGNTLTLSANLTNGAAGSLSGGTAVAAASGYLALNSNPTAGNTVTIGTMTYTFVNGTPAAAGEVALGQTITATLNDLKEAVNNTGSTSDPGYGSAFGAGTGQNSLAQITSVTGNEALVTASTGGAAGNSIVLSANLSDGAAGGAVGTVNSQLSGGGASVDLSSPADSQTALTTIAGAIATVASDRGAIGAGINQLNAALDVMNNTSQNLTSSLSSIQDANIGQVIANMSKYQVLEQTGIAALAQSNTSEQAVLRLLP
jgi:flagellin